MKVLELFAGIGACSVALKRIGIDVEIVDAVEIDKYAMASFNAIHNTNFVTQDITTYNKTFEDLDLICHGSPCQDFSIAGKQAGGDIGSGTRSSLMYETVRIVGQNRPKYVLWENVKNILSAKHKHNFDAYIQTMKTLGYNSYYQVLNAKDYGIPQNRERVYTISIRKDIDKGIFKFPEKEELKLRLKDMLEDKVDEKYYLDNAKIEKIINSNFMQEKKRIQEKEYSDTILARDWKDPKCVRVGGIFDTEKSKHQAGSIYDKEGISPTLNIMQGGWRQPSIMINNATKKGYDEAINGDSINLAYPESQTRRDRVGHQVSQTIQCNDSMGVVNNLRIRKLTPKECWRLMGFSDLEFEKAKNVPTSNTQLYKQAGNSIVVDVLEKIFRNLFKEKGIKDE
jgi:DNA (cytosine-5)-methyltransferase 1